MKNRLFLLSLCVLLILWPTRGMIAQELVVGGNMEDESTWTVYYLNGTEQPQYEFNYTDDVPAAGSGGCLSIYADGTFPHILFWQELTLEGGQTYKLTGAFKELTGAGSEGFWCQLYLSTLQPVEDGSDWNPEADRILGFNSWAGCDGAGVDGTFHDDGCDGIAPGTGLYTAPGQGAVTIYLGVKAGYWGTTASTIDILVDEVSLVMSSEEPEIPVPAYSNYLEDPGFEWGTAFEDDSVLYEPGGPPGWTGWIDKAFLDDIYPHSGDWCAALSELPVDEYNTSGFGQVVEDLNPGETYLTTAFGRLAWFTGTDQEWGLYIGVQNFGRPKVQTNMIQEDYLPVILAFTMGDTNTWADVWAWRGPGGEATVDDYGVWDYHNFLENPDFEDGSLSRWDAWGEWNTFVDTDEAFTGMYCGGIGEGAGGFAQIIRDLVPGVTYGIRASAKVANEGDWAQAGVKNYGGDEVMLVTTSTTYWDTTATFTMGETNTTAEIYFWKDAGGLAYVDSFLVCQMIVPEGVSDVESKRTTVRALPKSYLLDQNYPNPFNPETTIYYHLPEDAEVEITVYNLLGRNITTLVDNKQSAGSHKVQWNALDESGQRVSGGIYFYRIHAQTKKQIFNETKKMILLK